MNPAKDQHPLFFYNLGKLGEWRFSRPCITSKPLGQGCFAAPSRLPRALVHPFSGVAMLFVSHGQGPCV